MRRTRLSMSLPILGLLMFASQLGAHHSFAATYLEDKTEKIEGDVVQFLFRNPHSFIQVQSKGANGQVVQWAIEWAAGGQLSQGGVSRDTIKPGDHLIIAGNPSRNPEDHRMRMVNITRPSDGWKWGGRFE